MSYLAGLARPAAAIRAPAAAPVPADTTVRETFGEEHRLLEVELGAPAVRSAPVPPPEQPERPPTPALREESTSRIPEPEPRPQPRQTHRVRAAIEPTTADLRGRVAEPSKALSLDPVGSRPAPVVATPLATIIDRPAPKRAPPMRDALANPAVDMRPRVAQAREQPSALPITRPLPTGLAQAKAGIEAEHGPREASPGERMSELVETATPRATARHDAVVVRTAKAPDRMAASPRPDRAAIEVHIGSIALTVKAPAVAPPAAPVVPPAALARAQAAPARRREGFAFSASRHYLRWS